LGIGEWFGEGYSGLDLWKTLWVSELWICLFRQLALVHLDLEIVGMKIWRSRGLRCDKSADWRKRQENFAGGRKKIRQKVMGLDFGEARIGI
jgi:hypothetical protein